MSVTTEIMRINGGKSGIKTLLSQKNIPIVDGTLISDYPSILASKWPNFTSDVTYDGDKIRGSTKKYNQLVNEEGDFTAQNGTASSLGNNEYLFLASAHDGQCFKGVSVVQGHKYISKTSFNIPNGYSIRFFGGADDYIDIVGIGSYKDYYHIFSSSYGFYIVRDANDSNFQTIRFKNPMLIDLTEIYGAGNEPTSVAQFLADYPQFNYYVEYTQGGLFNGYYKGILLRQYDYIDTTANKLVKGSAEVDLGTIEWLLTSNSTFYISNLASSHNMICSKYKTLVNPPTIWEEAQDKTIFFKTSDYTVIRDSDYTDAAAFKNAMNGVELIYELETPIEIPLT